ncbi:hypothetical protein MITS9509_03132 [Synechococcus sp. MIT S9509]|nr:hypothetical protein MITS9504_03143 [Synechococcus sp. MIT S9504]KZR89063.1 hypothetical protein MITS9509_03132 [Synechococcus sp. MIT S9509]
MHRMSSSATDLFALLPYQAVNTIRCKDSMEVAQIPELITTQSVCPRWPMSGDLDILVFLDLYRN